MDKKIIAIVVAVVVVAAGVGVFFFNSGKADDDKGLSVLARVNTEGSGLYLKQGEIASEYMVIKGDKTVTYNPAKWGGKIFGTPGMITIQHMQFKELVETTLKLKFTLFREGDTLKADTVYYDAGVPNYTTFKGKTNLTGAYIWQPQYQIAVADGCVGLVMSDILFPEHTCCVIAGTNKYINNNEKDTINFLAAYVMSVEKLKSVIEAGSGKEYVDLVNLGVRKTGLTGDKAFDTVAASLKTIKYTYADNGDDVLGKLKTDISTLVDKYEANKSVNYTMNDLGFNSSSDFAKKFVNSTYLKKVMNGEHTVSNSKTVKVAVISGDIHQIALHYGIELGYFADYGLTVELSAQSNGAGVAVALQNGDSNFGLLGAPPLTITTINGKLVKG